MPFCPHLDGALSMLGTNKHHNRAPGSFAEHYPIILHKQREGEKRQCKPGPDACIKERFLISKLARASPKRLTVPASTKPAADGKKTSKAYSTYSEAARITLSPAQKLNAQRCWKDDHQSSSSRSPWGAGMVNIHTGSGDKLAQHNL
eukprot:1150144-Pelagomonas_calceolata.AAC.2